MHEKIHAKGVNLWEFLKKFTDFLKWQRLTACKVWIATQKLTCVRFLLAMTLRPIFQAFQKKREFLFKSQKFTNINENLLNLA